MAGYPEKAEKLNYTLHWAVDMLEKKGIDKWFIAYGTLLGVVREGSCIHGDDDVDICVAREHWDDLYDGVKKANMENYNPQWTKEDVIITRKAEKVHQVDFYICDVNENGDFYDAWEKVTWGSCLDENGKLPTMLFQGRQVNVPNNPKEKLANRYGPTWTQRIKRGTIAGDGDRSVEVL